MAHACDPSTQEQRQEAHKRDQPVLHNEFQTNQGRIGNLCLKTTTETNPKPNLGKLGMMVHVCNPRGTGEGLQN